MMRCGVGPIRANVWKNQPELGIIAVSDAHCLIAGLPAVRQGLSDV